MPLHPAEIIALAALLAAVWLLSGCALIEVRTDTSEQRQAQASATTATVAATVRKRDVVRRLGTDPKTGEQVERTTETERTDTNEDKREDRQEAAQATVTARQETSSPAVESGLDGLLQVGLAAATLFGFGTVGWQARALRVARSALGTAHAAVRHVADYEDELEQAKNPAEVQQAKSGSKMRAQDRGTHDLIQTLRGKRR